MRILGLKSLYAAVAASAAVSVSAKNILLSNDDGWASTNIRAAFDALTAAGHDVLLVAPVHQRSGYGGTFHLPRSPVMEVDGEFSAVKAGDPSWGHEEGNDRIWYFDGTPASCVAFALDYVIPKYFPDTQIDLTVAGPNEGTNMGPALYTLSGTMGATYTSVGRGIPAIAFSGSNGNNSYYKDELPAGKSFPAIINAQKVVQLVDAVFEAAETSGDKRALPLGVGLNVNIPAVGDQSDVGCDDPPFVAARMSGPGAYGFGMVYDEASGLFRYRKHHHGALSVCLNGNCSLPSEPVVLKKCEIAVSEFSIDYDAPLGSESLNSEPKSWLNHVLDSANTVV